MLPGKSGTGNIQGMGIHGEIFSKGLERFRPGGFDFCQYIQGQKIVITCLIYDKNIRLPCCKP